MVMGELRSAIRSLKSTPAPVAAAVLTLALAIGTNAGMVGLIGRALLFRERGALPASQRTSRARSGPARCVRSLQMLGALF